MSEKFPETLIEITWWTSDKTCIGMGAERMFDYTLEGSTFDDRLGRCYELALGAFIGWDKISNEAYIKSALPSPIGLVHGSWHGPGAPRRIDHAWVLLDDGRVWEPITALLCNAVNFDAYTNATQHFLYDEYQARVLALRNQHYGPWHEPRV